MRDINDFDATSIAESGFDLDVKEPDGETSTGVILVIRGKHSDTVNNWINKTVNDEVREQQLARKRGKIVEPKTMEEIEAQNLEGALVRVAGWKNVTQPFDPALLRAAFKRNRHWVDQVVEASNNLGNFSTRPAPSSPNTPPTNSDSAS